MSEEPGYEIASAYVSVSPEAESFPEQLEEQIGEVNFVVQIPVVPDAGDFPAEVEAAVGEVNLDPIQVPVVPDTSDFQLLLNEAVKETDVVATVPVVPDMAGFAEAMDAGLAEGEKPVTVPVTPDMAGFAESAESEAGTAGQEAGTTFSERLSASVTAAVQDIWPEITTGAGPAGETAGSAFGEAFVTAALPKLSSLLTSDTAGLVGEAGTAGEEAGASFASRFSAAAGAATAGASAPLAKLAPAAESEAEDAGEVAGTGFLSRFTSGLGGIKTSLAGAFGGAEAEGEAGGLAAGEGFGSSLKNVITGSISPMEALMGAGFVAAAADMSSKFQAAMELIHTQAGVAQPAIAGLSSSVLNLAGQVGVSPDSLAQALYHVESSFQSVGISGQSAMNLLQTAAEGARIGNANLVDVTNALDAAIVSGVGGITSYGQAMNVLNGIVGTGDMTMQDLADAMGTGLMAAGKAYGQTIQQIGAALATLGDNNIRGAKAATDVRMAWQAIEKPLTTATGTLNQLGLTQTSLANEMTQHGLTAAIGMFIQHLEASKVPVDEWGQYVTEIFGKRAGVGIQVLIDQYSRLQGKQADLEKSSHGLGSAWASTQATMQQHVKELESGFEALMIKIGNGLLPAVDSFMSMVSRNLPAIENFGSSIAHLVAPAVTVFFKGLEDVLKVLFGPLRSVTEAFAVAVVTFASIMKVISIFKAVGAAWSALTTLLAANPWVLVIAAIAAAAFLIIKYHKQIWDVIKGTWDKIAAFFKEFWPEILAYATGGLSLLVGVIIKYHEDIWKAIHDAWDHILDFLKGWFPLLLGIIAGPFGAIVGLIIKYHQQIWDTIQQVWKQIWDFIQTIISGGITWLKTSWDTIWSDIKDVWGDIHDWFTDWWNFEINAWKSIVTTVTEWLTTAWNAIWTAIKTVWGDISSWFTTWWTTAVTAWEKTVTTLETWFKTAWNQIWTDIKTVWGEISTWFTTWWSDLVSAWETTVTTVENWLVTAWDTIKNDVTTAFDDIKTTITTIWDDIVSAVEAAVNTIKTAISDVTSAISTVASLPGKALSTVTGGLFAGGGVVPGYAPGHDTVNAKLSPGEAVLVPEAVRAIGPGTINAINAHYSAGRRGYSDGGLVPSLLPGFSAGGVAGGLSPYQAGQAAGQFYGAGAYDRTIGGGQGATIVLNFNGTQWPTPEQQQAMMMQLGALVGVS